MLSVSHKSKQYLLVALKVLILVAAFWYILVKLGNTDSRTLDTLTSTLQTKGVLSIIIIVSLSVANWFFEILKWQTIISPVKKLSFSEAAKQSLAALTTSIATPNRIGDYGAKAYFFPAEERKNVLLLNFFSNSMQMLVTTVFGVIGLIYIVQNYGISFSSTKMLLFISAIIVFILLGYIFKEKQLILKGLSINKVLYKLKNISKPIKLKVLLFSLIRYVIFSYLFYYLLRFFGANLSYTDAIFIIFAMYLLVSIIPTIFIFDVVIRSGVAVWLFSFVGVPELTVVTAVLSMWILNFGLPAAIGSIFVLSYKPSER
jgi:hypothetical protein